MGPAKKFCFGGVGLVGAEEQSGIQFHAPMPILAIPERITSIQPSRPNRGQEAEFLAAAVTAMSEISTRLADLLAASRTARLNFVCEQINSAFAFHETAQLAYIVGNNDRGDRARDKAIAAYHAGSNAIRQMESRLPVVKTQIHQLASVLKTKYPERFRAMPLATASARG